MNIVALLFVTLLVVILLLAFWVRSLREELRMERVKLEVTEKQKEAFAAQVQRLSNATGVISGNRKEADEKIEELHSGDAVDNALSGLSKRKN